MKNPVMLITCLGHALCHISMLTLPVVIVPIRNEFGLSLTQVTFAGTIAYLLFGLGAIPVGIAVRFLGARIMLLIYFGGIGLASIMIGFAPSFGLFVAGMVILGTVASIYHVAGTTLIAQQMKKTGQSFGIHGIAGISGITIAPLVAGLLAGWTRWRYAYLILILPALIGFLWTVRTKKDSDTDDTVKSNDTLNDNKPMQWQTRTLFILLLGVLIINGFVYRAILTVFPMHLAERVSLAALPDVVTGGVLSSLVMAFGILGMYMVGRVADRMDGVRLYALLLAFVVPALALVGLMNGVFLLVASLTFTLFYFPCQAVENTILGTHVPHHLMSFMFSLKFVLSFGLGSLGALTAGFVVEQKGTTQLFLILTAAMLLSFALAFGAVIIKRRMPISQTR